MIACGHDNQACAGYLAHPLDFLIFLARISTKGLSFSPKVSSVYISKKNARGSSERYFLANMPITSSKTHFDLMS